MNHSQQPITTSRCELHTRQKSNWNEWIPELDVKHTQSHQFQFHAQTQYLKDTETETIETTETIF